MVAVVSKEEKERPIRYMQMSKSALHAISPEELRADRARFEQANDLTQHAVNKKELAIVNAEIKRRPMIAEDVFK